MSTTPTQVTPTLYHVDWSIFTPEALPELFAQVRKARLALVDNIVAKHKAGTLTLDDVFGEEDFDYNLLSQTRFRPADHLKMVCDNPEFRQAYDKVQEEVTKLNLEVSLNLDLYQAYKSLAEAPEAANYTPEQQSALKKLLQDYELSGVTLQDEAKEAWSQAQLELSDLQRTYANHNLDSRQAVSFHTTNESYVEGLPESIVAYVKKLAADKKLDGYLFTLDPTVYSAVLAHAKKRDLREYLWRKNARLASKEDETGKCDNTPVAQRIYELKTKLANLLGFPTHAHYSLANKMAQTPEEVLTFLESLAEKALPGAKAKHELLEKFAHEQGLEGDLEPWDFTFYNTLYNQTHFNIDEEVFRAYFPVTKVVPGLFELLARLYNVEFKQDEQAAVYHPDVKFYRVYRNGELVAGLYLDLYAREGKTSGAWVSGAFGRAATATRAKLPVAYLTCNFQAPLGDKPTCLLTWDVITLFHEMGHALHHMLSQVNVELLCGTNVEKDAVELPSQLHENWVFAREALDLFAAHVDTGAPMPDDVYELYLKSSGLNFDATFLTRQLQFALFDMKLYSQEPGKDKSVQEVNQEVFDRFTQAISGKTYPTWFANVFLHIFMYNYSAGYYSYLWAEVLSCDAYAAFEETGDVLNAEVAARFVDTVLARGGTLPSAQNYLDFRGRQAQLEPLLRNYGIDA